MKKVIIVVATIVLAGCSGKVDYVPPATTAMPNSKVVSKSKDEAWAELIPALSKNFFVVNTIDKSSGLVNISYSGDPEKYVDCGRVHSYVSNLHGDRTYDFNAATAHENYEVMQNGILYEFQRAVDLDGRMNIVVESQGPHRSLITVNTRYILTLRINGTASGRPIQPLHEEISFNTGGVGKGVKISCSPNGKFEQDVLDLVN